MQNIQYPSIYSQSAQPPLQQHLFENTDQHIKFIPISQSSQKQFSQQQFQPQQPLQPPMYINQYIPSQKNSYVKDLDFLNQKFYLISILSVLILWTFLYAILYFILAVSFYKDMKDFSKTTSTQIPFEIIGLIAFVIAGTLERFRNTIITNLCYFGAIACYTFLIFSIVACFYSPPSDSISGSTVFLMFLWSIQGANAISTIIFLIYLFIETKQVKLYKTFIFQFICFLPLGFVYWPLLFGMLILLPYSLLLWHVLQQIQKGRFNLKQDQIIAGGLCVCFGLFIPFRIGKFL